MFPWLPALVFQVPVSSLLPSRVCGVAGAPELALC